MSNKKHNDFELMVCNVLTEDEEQMDFTTARSHDNLSGMRMLKHSVSQPNGASCRMDIQAPVDKNANHLGRFAKLKRRISRSLNKLSKFC